MDKEIEGMKVNFWLAEDPNNVKQGLCKACNSTFLIDGDGWTAIIKHHKTKKHTQSMGLFSN